MMDAEYTGQSMSFTGSLNRLNKLKSQLIAELGKMNAANYFFNYRISSAGDEQKMIEDVKRKGSVKYDEYILHTQMLYFLSRLKLFIFEKNAELKIHEILSAIEYNKAMLSMVKAMKDVAGNHRDQAISLTQVEELESAIKNGKLYLEKSNMENTYILIGAIDDAFIETLILDIKVRLNKLEDQLVCANAVQCTIDIPQIVAKRIGLI